MKKIIVIFVLSIISIGCESESTELDTEGFNLPEWLKGEYEGVHTGEYLRISSQNIEFKVDNQEYLYNYSLIVSETEDENHYTITTESDILIFNKTTLDEEINFQFNELNLGWFKHKKIE
ncbi:hypothetical protein EQG68_10860 [Flavobacterium piscinae]|uniref:Lipocalin-like domain-containing protein n=1 Tax=Flavobacterium piscinae TaxID=2506424 RepID=A0A4Q1KR09_9FLAO|nr:hypothetical protein [Flavobacterium piscinae]RXR31374.1 hypothetical protein EQG68_10860 [Flavobacterium piscinae]